MADYLRQIRAEDPKTVHNAYYNGITLDGAPQFENANLPMAAIAGRQEPPIFFDSVRKLSELNENCRCEIWDAAAHNIPFKFPGKFSDLIQELLVCPAPQITEEDTAE